MNGDDDLLEFASDRLFTHNSQSVIINNNQPSSPPIKDNHIIFNNDDEDEKSNISMIIDDDDNHNSNHDPLVNSTTTTTTTTTTTATSSTSSSRRLPLWMDKVPVQLKNNNPPTSSSSSSSTTSNNIYSNNELIKQSDEKRIKKVNATTVDHAQWLEEMRGFTEVELPASQGRVICFDLETTGFTVDDSIIEIGAVEIIDGCRTGLTFQSYARPKASIHFKAQEVHQLSAYLLNSSPPIDFVLASFMDFVGDAMLVAHNLAFDHRMLVQELMRSSIPINKSMQCFCTMKYYRKIYKDTSYSLDSISQQLKINKLLLRRTHGAMIDSEILAIIYCHLARLPTNYPTLKIIDKLNQAPWSLNQSVNQLAPNSDLDLNNIYNHHNSNSSNNKSIISGINSIVLSSHDIDRCLLFYQSVMSLEVRNTNEIIINDHQSIIVQKNNNNNNDRGSSSSSLSICFISNVPILTVLQRLFTLNIPIIKGPLPRTTSSGNGAIKNNNIISIFINDPDGNLIEIAEILK